MRKAARITLPPTWPHDQLTRGRLSPNEARALRDALEIADSCARSDIESFCEWNAAGATRWYDTSEGAIHPADDHPRNAVAQAVRYLGARGILIRHGASPHLVRFEVPQ